MSVLSERVSVITILFNRFFTHAQHHNLHSKSPRSILLLGTKLEFYMLSSLRVFKALNPFVSIGLLLLGSRYLRLEFMGSSLPSMPACFSQHKSTREFLLPVSLFGLYALCSTFFHSTAFASASLPAEEIETQASGITSIISYLA